MLPAAEVIDQHRHTARMKNAAIWLLRLLFAVLLIPVLAACFLYTQQHAMIYHPRPYTARDFARLPGNIQELDFTIGAGSQSAFYVSPRNGAHRPERLWVAFCGNGSVALDWTKFTHDYPNERDGFLLIDYPGYGKSRGYATIQSTRAAADGALAALAKRLNVDQSELETRLDVIGHSLGAAAALDFATHHSIERAVLYAPFTSLREEAATVVGRTLSHLLVENYDNRARLTELGKQSPLPRILIVHGTDDDVIPFRMGQTLASEFPVMTEFYPIQQGDHVTVLDLSRKQVYAWMARRG